MKTVHLVRRTLVVATITLALLAVAAGQLAQRDRASGTPVRLAAAELHSGRSCADLLQWYVDRGVARVTPYGWSLPMYAELRSDVAAPGTMVPQSATDQGAQADAQGTSSDTGTNVQEVGVDEPDIAKTTGDLLVTVKDGQLTTYDVSGDQPVLLATTPLHDVMSPQLLLAGDQAVVIGTDRVSATAELGPFGPPPVDTRVLVLDLSAPTRPTVVSDRVVGGGLVTARQVGDVVRLVVSQSLPTLPFEQPGKDVSVQEALQHNRDVVRASTIQDWVPSTTLQTPDGSSTTGQLVDCGDVATPDNESGLGTLSVVGFDAASPESLSTTAVATSSSLAYLTPSRLYLAATPTFAFPMVAAEVCCAVRRTAPDQPRDTTALYAFDLTGTSASYLTSGRVSGTVRDSWSLDEQDGVLRVVTSTGGFTDAGATSVVTVRPEAGGLVPLGRIDGLGKGETLQSVRWLGDLAVLVTYRQTDPFFAVDLSDAGSPRLLGALHLPGFSTYLHPVGPGLVLGLGQTGTAEPIVEPERPDSSGPLQPTTGPMIPFTPSRPKATLFDVADPTHPSEVDTVTYPAGTTGPGTDTHQVTWLPDRQTLLTIVHTFDSQQTWISALHVSATGLDDRLLELGPEEDATSVRTLPTADGRVLVVTATSARFLDV